MWAHVQENAWDCVAPRVPVSARGCPWARGPCGVGLWRGGAEDAGGMGSMAASEELYLGARARVSRSVRRFVSHGGRPGAACGEGPPRSLGMPRTQPCPYHPGHKQVLQQIKAAAFNLLVLVFL